MKFLSYYILCLCLRLCWFLCRCWCMHVYVCVCVQVHVYVCAQVPIFVYFKYISVCVLEILACVTVSSPLLIVVRIHGLS